MELLNGFFNWIMSRRMSQIEDFMRHPHQVQERIFDDLIGKARHTEWGKKYGYTDIRTVDQYQRNTPISSYEMIHPFIERMMKGEEDILWPGQVKWFSKSSGTTNARSKFIPVSDESLEECHFKGGKDLIAMYVSRNPETKLFSGKSIGIGGTYQRFDQNPDVYFGDVSAIIMKNLPIWAEYMRTPSLEVALMDKWEEKLERMARDTSGENVINISGVPTWTILLLQRILEITGKQSIIEVWPNLEVFTHGAVAFGPYRESFRRLIGNPDMRFVELYNASEGFFGMQDTDQPDEMLLMLDYGVFYEFVPLDEVGNDHPKAVTLDGVEIGKNYAMLISTNGGLWRYMIGDTVRFTSKTPYRIKISGRTKHFINAFGEEVIIENAETAIIHATANTGAKIANFTACPIYLEAGKRGGHEWLIEFEIAPDSLERFTQALDTKLREINSDYDAKRYKDLALEMPIVRSVPQGTFYKWMKQRGKLGGQHKVPRLANNREYVEEILGMLYVSQ